MVENDILKIIGADISNTIPKTDLAIIPFGSVEYHGPHAPLGTDTFIAQELSRRLGKRLNAILYPLVAYTTCPVSTHNLPGTLHIDSDLMTAYVEEIFQGLFRSGIKRILVLNAHDGNIDIVNCVTDRLLKDHPDRTILLINWWQTLPISELESLGLFSQDGGHGHGGPLETSAAWAVATETVDLSKATDEKSHLSDDKSPWPGYSGRISESSIDKGQILLTLAENKIFDIVNDWLQ
jgi:creatinine amidohydrolase